MSVDTRVVLLSPPETPCMSQASGEYDHHWTQFSTLDQRYISNVSREQVTAAYQYSEHHPLAAVHCSQECAPPGILNALLSPEYNNKDSDRSYAGGNVVSYPAAELVAPNAHHAQVNSAPGLSDTIYQTPSTSRRSNTRTQMPYMSGSLPNGHLDHTSANWPPRTEHIPPPVPQELRPAARKMKRFRLTHAQTRLLIAEFAQQAHPDATHRERLAQQIPGLSPRQVQVWFQNRRAKIKRASADERQRLIATTMLPAPVSTTHSQRAPHIAPASNVNTTLTSPTTIAAMSGLTNPRSGALEILRQIPDNDPGVDSPEETLPRPIRTTHPHDISPSLDRDDKISSITGGHRAYEHSRRNTTGELSSRYYSLHEHYRMPLPGEHIEHSTDDSKHTQRPSTSFEVAYDGLRSYTTELAQTQNRAQSLSEEAALYEGHTASDSEPWPGMPVLDGPNHQSPIVRYPIFSDFDISPTRLDRSENDAATLPASHYARYPNLLPGGGLEQPYAHTLLGNTTQMGHPMSRHASLEAAQHQTLQYQQAVFVPDPGLQTPQHAQTLEGTAAGAHMFAPQPHGGVMTAGQNYWGDVSRS